MAVRNGGTKKNGKKGNGGQLGFEAELFLAADKLRGNMEPSEYKHVALGLIFLKYISDAFEAQHAALLTEDYADAEDPRRIPRRKRLLGAERGPLVAPSGKRQAARDRQAHRRGHGAIEKRKSGAQGRAAQGYARPALNKVMLGELIDLISDIGMGEEADRPRTFSAGSTNISCRQFAGAEGKRGGEFYTPRSVVRVLVEMLEPYKGRVYDPCCGSGGMFVQSEKFVEEHGGRIGDISIYGQESNYTTWRLCQDEPCRARHRLRHQVEQRGQLPQGRIQRPEGGLRPRQSALQRVRLGRRPVARRRALEIRSAARGQRQLRLAAAYPAPPVAAGTAGVVLANGSMSSTPNGRGRHPPGAMVGGDVVDCMIALPGQLFYSTQIPVCLWFLARDKKQPQVPRPARRDAVHRRAQARPHGGPDA